MSENILRGAIQKVATGPEFSKNISEEDSYNSMLDILGSDVDSVQAAIYLIALRMKRETMDENIGSLKALIEKSNIITSSSLSGISKSIICNLFFNIAPPNPL